MPDSLWELLSSGVEWVSKCIKLAKVLVKNWLLNQIVRDTGVLENYLQGISVVHVCECVSKCI